MMVDVDEEPPILDTMGDFTEALEARAIGRDHAVKFLSPPWRFQQLARIEECQFVGHGVLIPADDAFILREQGQRQTQLRTDTVAVRADVAGDADALAAVDRFEEAIHNLGVGFHAGRTNGD